MRAIFLDRDGVINKYPGDRKYVTAWKDFYFLPRAKKAIAALREGKFKLFLISNQAGVGKNIFTQKKLDLITANMLVRIRKAGGNIDGIYYCTHRPQEDCPCRKPKAGTIRLIMKKYPIDIKRSFFIGDTIRDVKTAHAAGCKSILVLSGKEKASGQNNWEANPDFVFKDLYAAAEFVLKKK